MQIIEQPNEWSESFSNFGKGLVGGYQSRADETAIKKTLDSLDKNASPREILNAIIGTPTYSQDSKKQAIQNLMNLEKTEETKRSHQALEDFKLSKQAQDLSQKEAELGLKREKEAARASEAQERLSQGRQKISDMQFLGERKLGLTERAQSEKERKALIDEELQREKLAQSEKSSEASLNLQERKFEESKRATQAKEQERSERLQLARDAQSFKQSKNAFDEAVSKNLAKDYSNLLSNIVPGLEEMEGNMDYLRDIESKISKYGFLTAWTGWKSGNQALIERATQETLKPYIDLFARGGAISNIKYQNLIDRFTIKATDRKAIAKVKLDGLENFVRSSLKLAKKRMDVIKQYKGQIPKEVEDSLNKEAEDLVDASIASVEMAESEDSPIADIPIDPVKGKGRTIRGPDGKLYKSNGVVWTLVP